MTSELVAAFNALPRRAKAPSGLVPNEWHFDIRYVQLEPTPSHVVFFIQPQSQFSHMERLPIGLSSGESGAVFFPETAYQAAPTVAQAILHAFAISNLGMNDRRLYPEAPAPYAPWKLTTEDKVLALAVAKELRKLGVRPEPLCDIGVSKREAIRIAQESFGRLFRILAESCGPHGALHNPPDSIRFEDIVPVPSAPQKTPMEMELEKDYNDDDKAASTVLNYYTEWARILPSDGKEYDAKVDGENMMKEMELIRKKLEDKPEKIINSEADRGNAEAALDYALRLTVGLGCKPNRKRAREYLIKAAYGPNSSPRIKAMAHGQLITWHISSATNSTAIRSRYLFAGAHHCNQAAIFCRAPGVSPPGARASPCVLWYVMYRFRHLATKAPELCLLCPEGFKALEAREAQVEEGRAKMANKRLKNPVRYRCAAPDCHVEADTGAMLQRCSGPCDADKKPYYCSKECQKTDWKNHKPFCRPGAECSVIDNGTKYDMAATAPSHKSSGGAIQVPITMPDGSNVLISSSTMSPELLKDIHNLSLGEGSSN